MNIELSRFLILNLENKRYRLYRNG